MTAWKDFEYRIAKWLREANIPARRMSRAGNWSQMDYEVHVDGAEFLKIDGKHTAAKPFRHHGLVNEIAFKYCKKPEDEPVLYTHNYREHGGFVTIRAEFFGKMLSAYLSNIGKLAPMPDTSIEDENANR